MRNDDTEATVTPTRRDYMKHGGAVIGGGVLAGCSGRSSSGPTPESTATETATSAATDTETAEVTETETSTGDGSYTVEMFPIGEVTFEEVPETWNAGTWEGWGDMAVALGQAEGNQSSALARYDMWYDLLDIEFRSDFASLWNDGGYDKEVFYELDPDVFLIDPNVLMQWDDNFDESDVEEIETNVSPFFGAYNRTVTGAWQQEMGYVEQAPTMLEAFEKLAEVFQQRERAQAMLDFHAEVQSTVQSRLEGVEPAEVAVVGAQPDEGSFTVHRAKAPGYKHKQYRDLDVVDAAAGRYPDGKEFINTDWEGLLDINPDHLLINYGIYSTWWNSEIDDVRWDSETFDEQFAQKIENDSVGQQLTAVQNGNIHPGGTHEQGPVVNLFQLEYTAQCLYPEQFGEFDPETYPEVPEEYQLFDRGRVADIVNGNI